MKTSSYIIAGVLVVAAAVLIHRTLQRRQGAPKQNAALDPNAWASEFGTDSSAQWVYDTYIRKAA